MVGCYWPQSRWPELLSVCGLVVLGAYIATDPIGRSAALSYEAAAQSFIDTRDLGAVSFDSFLDAEKTLFLPENSRYKHMTKPIAEPVAFALFPMVPDLDTSGTAFVPTPTGKLVSENMDHPDPLTLELGNQIRPTPNIARAERSLLDNEDTCTESDRLIGLCGNGGFFESLIGQ